MCSYWRLSWRGSLSEEPCSSSPLRKRGSLPARRRSAFLASSLCFLLNVWTGTLFITSHTYLDLIGMILLTLTGGFVFLKFGLILAGWNYSTALGIISTVLVGLGAAAGFYVFTIAANA